MTANNSVPKGFPASARGATTVDRALKVVGEILDEGGESSLRLADVSQRSGVSVGSLYHHFGSREGLIGAAKERQFFESLPTQIRDEIDYMVAAKTPTEFVERFDEVLRQSDSPERAAGRRRRLEMIGAAASRPGSLGGVIALQTSYVDLLEGVARTLQERGWLHASVDLRAFALFLHSTSMGRVLLEIDEQPVELEEWHRVVRTVIDFLVLGVGQEQVGRRAS